MAVPVYLSKCLCKHGRKIIDIMTFLCEKLQIEKNA